MLVEAGGVQVYTPGRTNLVAAKGGERDKSSARSQSNESGREHEVAVNSSNGAKALRRVATGRAFYLPGDLVNDKEAGGSRFNLAEHRDKARDGNRNECRGEWSVCAFDTADSGNQYPLSREADIAKVQEWLGHANVSTIRLYDRRKSKPEDRPTFYVTY